MRGRVRIHRHGAELEHRELLHVRARAGSGGRTPGRASHAGCATPPTGTPAPRARARCSRRRCRSPASVAARRPERARGEMLTSGMPSTSGRPRPGPMISNMRGDDVDAHVHVAAAGGRWVEHVAVVVLGERDDHAVDGERSRTIEARSSITPRTGTLGDSRRHALRRHVHEPDQLDAVLRVAQQLARDELADVAGADDDGVLGVGVAAAGARPHRRPAGGDEDDSRPRQTRPHGPWPAGRAPPARRSRAGATCRRPSAGRRSPTRRRAPAAPGPGRARTARTGGRRRTSRAGPP